MNTQTTFTKQKRELAKANSLIQSIRAQEVRSIRFDKDGKQQTIERSAYVTETPEAIAQQVLEIVRAVVAQHGARQQANSVNKGHFEFAGIQAELTVPQLRTLQDSLATLTALVNKLPAENLRLVPNGELDGRPAFFHPVEDITATKTRNVPYEETESTRVRTYEEKYEEILYKTQQVEVDYGLPTAAIKQLKLLLEDLSTAIQVAIDEANALPHTQDAELERVIAGITAAFQKALGQK